MWRAVLVLSAVAAALVPIDPARVERWYSTGLYPRLQAVVTPLTNRIPIALLDLAVGACLITGGIVFLRRVAALGLRRTIVHGALSLLVAAAGAYLLFLVMWGLNYRRVPLERKLDYDRARITRPAAVALANRAVMAMNGGFAAAHTTVWDSRSLDSIVRESGAPPRCGTRRSARRSEAVAALRSTSAARRLTG